MVIADEGLFYLGAVGEFCEHVFVKEGGGLAGLWPGWTETEERQDEGGE